MCLGSCQFLDFLGCLETGKVLRNTAGIDFVRARQKVREFFFTPFFSDLVGESGFRKTHFSISRLSVRLFVRPSVCSCVQKPIAVEQVDFASLKMGGSKKRQVPLLRQKIATPCQSVFVFCEIRSSHIFFVVSAHQGL